MKCVKERDTFIDFLKGICIIWVILTHNLPTQVMEWSGFILWGSMAVPLFLMLQAYHVMCKYNILHDSGMIVKFSCFFSVSKIWNRILRPFIVITLTTAIILICTGHSPKTVLMDCIRSGGIGPGSYYIWVYLQFALLCPVILLLFNMLNRGGGC